MALSPDSGGRDDDDAGDADTAEVVAGQEGDVCETVLEFDDEDKGVWGEDGGEARGLEWHCCGGEGVICTMKLRPAKSRDVSSGTVLVRTRRAHGNEAQNDRDAIALPQWPILQSTVHVSIHPQSDPIIDPPADRSGHHLAAESARLASTQWYRISDSDQASRHCRMSRCDVRSSPRAQAPWTRSP